MIKKFQGSEARRLLVEALRRQQVVNDSEEIANALADEASLVEVIPGDDECFIRQSDSDDDIYLILTGRVSIQINGHEVATRGPGEHVGEMTAIDPMQQRSASVIATERTVMAKYAETTFSKLAGIYPVLWRRLALVLGNRLRERGRLVPVKNARPRIFVGSSKEAIQIARAIHTGLQHDDFLIRPWADGVFKPSSTTLEDLLKEVRLSDFAILVLTAEDWSKSRDIEMMAPRDNCIFELGLFMGLLGRDRTFMVIPRGSSMKMPSDLLGVTPLFFKNDHLDHLESNLAPTCEAIRNAINKLGAK